MPVKIADFSRLVRCRTEIEADLVPFMADVIRVETDPYVPFATGALAGSAYVNEADLQEGRIVYGNVDTEHGKPVNAYAEAQYEGLPNKTKTMHPQATSKWDEASIADNLARWQQIAAKRVGQITGRTR